MGLDPVTIMAGATIVGGLMGADAAGDAADAQVGAANNATANQRAMFDRTVQLQQPYNNAGVAATSRLSTLLGLSYPSGSTGAPGTSAAPQAPSPIGSAQTSSPTGRLGDWSLASIGSSPAQANDPGYVTVYDYDNAGNPIPVRVPTFTAFTAQQQAAQPQAAQSPQPMVGDPNDPAYGSLLKPFGMGDFQLDPGIQFQMQQGQQALQSSQAAKNGVLSGAALKDLLSFNQGMAGTGYQSAFDRYMANKSFTLGSLMDTARLGQAAAGNTVNNAGSFSTGIANTITGAGNANAAGIIGSANALSGGLSGASNAYMLRNILNGGGGGTTSGAVNMGTATGADMDLFYGA